MSRFGRDEHDFLMPLEFSHPFGGFLPEFDRGNLLGNRPNTQVNEKWKGLTSDDISILRETLLKLSNELVMAQESSFSNQALIEIIEKLLICIETRTHSDIISIKIIILIK
jgi:hypothetical protein